MRRSRLVASLALAVLLPASCGTIYRYGYHDYDEPTIDEKNRMRELKMHRSFGTMVPSSSHYR